MLHGCLGLVKLPVPGCSRRLTAADTMPTVRYLFVALRVLIAGGIIAAVVAQLIRSIERTTEAGGDLTAMVVNFFSFFTIDSNVLAAIAAAVGVVILLLPKGAATEPTWFTTLRLAAVTYMTVTLVVYNLLLRGIELPQGQTVPWSNEILHVVAPLLVIVDWLFAPGRGRLEWNRIWVVVIFPVVWTAYTLIRGPFGIDPVALVGPWYPYPFMNPDTSANGYLSVAFYVILITGIFLATAAGAIAISRRWKTAPLTAA